jgi:hypothetical protein
VRRPPSPLPSSLTRPVGSTSKTGQAPVNQPYPAVFRRATDWPRVANQAALNACAADEKEEDTRGGQR